MAAKLLGLFSFMLATSAVTSVLYYKNSFGPGRYKFHDTSSEEARNEFYRHLNQGNPLPHLQREFNLFDLFKHFESGPHDPDFRILRKQLHNNFMFRNRNNLHPTATPLIMKLLLSSDKTPIKSTSNSLDKNTINFVNVDSYKEANNDLIASTKETDVITENISISHPRSSTLEKYVLFNNEIASSISPKMSKTLDSNLDRQSFEQRGSFTQELATDSNHQVKATDSVSNFISSLLPQMSSENDGRSQNTTAESVISKIPQSEKNERNSTRNIFQKSSESNQSSLTHSVLNKETSDGFFTNLSSSDQERESFATDITDSSALFTTDSTNGKSNGLFSFATSESFNEIKISETSSNLDTNASFTNNYPRHMTSGSEVNLGESVSPISTLENRQSTILPAESTSSGEKLISTGNGSFDKYSTTDLNPSASTTDKENSFIYFKSTTVNEVTHNTVKNIADPVKSGSSQEIANEISVLTNPTSFKEKLVKDTIPLDHVINVSAIRTARIVVSVVFLTIALMAIAILSIYLFKIRRNSVQYDQLLLLP